MLSHLNPPLQDINPPLYDKNYVLLHSALDKKLNENTVEEIKQLLEIGASVNQSVPYLYRCPNTHPHQPETLKNEPIPLIISLILKLTQYKDHSVESNVTLELIELFIVHGAIIEGCLAIGILLDNLPLLKKFDIHEKLLNTITFQALGQIMIPEFFDALFTEMPSLVEAKDADGCTLLAFAIFYNNAIAVNQLLQHGANMQAPCYLKVESLKKYFAGSDKEVKLEAYLQNTFNKKIPEAIQGTQVELAVLLNRDIILEQLHNHTAIPIGVINKNIFLAKSMGNEEAFQYLMHAQRDSLIKLATQSDFPTPLTSRPTLFFDTQPVLSFSREDQIKAITSNHRLGGNNNTK